MSTKLKRQPAGFYAHTMPPAGYEAAHTGIWLELPWSEVETAPGVYDFSTILSTLADVKAAGMKDLRVRIMAGYQVPDYLKEKFGTYTATDPIGKTPTPRDVVCWWRSGFGKHYDGLIGALASVIEAKLDIIEVSASLTTSVYAEPFIRQIGDAATKKAMLAAGYTAVQDQAAMKRMILTHGKYLLRTRTGLACSPWQNAETGKQDLTWTQSLMEYGRQVLGKRLILENNSLDGADHVGSLYTDMYAAQKTLGAPLAYQTHAYPRLVDPSGCVDYALSLGARALEPASNLTLTKGWTPEAAAADAARLVANR